MLTTALTSAVFFVLHPFKISPLFLLLPGILFFISIPEMDAAPESMPKIARANAPSWVKPQEISLTPPPIDQTGDGIRTLLVDEQGNAREDVAYNHYARQYLSRSGVEDDSRLSITFDPSYQTLAINKLVVYRNGKKIDRLATQEIKLLHQEGGLERLLYDGRITAVMLLPDIRVGDMLEYAYTVRGSNPIFHGNYFNSFYARWSVPVDHLYHRMIWPAGRKLAIKSIGAEFAPTVTASGPDKEYVWEKSNIPALISDGDLPTSFDPYDWVQMSELQTWGEVARWACKLCVIQDGGSDVLQEQVESIKKIGDRKKQVMAALGFVQDNIRYLGIEVGAHSYKPYPIATVMERRFGDCKDKSLLLCALLRRLGFEAYPAMVETDYKKTIGQWLPTALAFDHVVTQLRLDGHTYWLDPTRAYQGGGLDDVYFPDYGLALVVKDDTDSLVKITPQGFDAVKTEITESYAFKDYKGDATLNIHTVEHGRHADGLREWISDTNPDEMKKQYLNFYAKQYPHIEAAAPPVFHDDRENNVVSIDESYRISEFWQPHADEKNRLYGEFYPQIFRDQIQKPKNSLRTMPYAIVFPEKMIQTVRISFPKNLKFTPESVDVKDASFHFTYDRTVQSNEVTLRYSLETLRDQVEASRIADYLKNIKTTLDNLGYEVWVNKDAALKETPPATPVPTPAREAQVPAPAPEQSASVDDAHLHKILFFMLPCMLAAGVVGLLRLVQKRMYVPPVKLPPPLPPVTLHRCNVCGQTELSSPDLEFRVARDGEEYCFPHIPRMTGIDPQKPL